jgi:hypothetical protein
MIILPGKSTYVWQRFFSENKTLVYSYVARKIQHALTHTLPEIKLFKFDNVPDVTTIKETDYLFMLERARSHFVSTEAYELAASVTKTINDYYIDKVIQESMLGE